MIAKWLAVAATMALGAFGTLCPAYGQSLYFLYSNGVYSTLTVPDSIFTQAFAINNSGQYVGEYGIASDGNIYRYGYIYGQGVYTTLVLPTGYSELNTTAINNLGEVVGS